MVHLKFKIERKCFMNNLDGIKVMLINMPLRENALPNNLPLGPALLAARLRQHGANPIFVDLNVYRIKDELAKSKGLENGRHLTLEETKDLLEKYLIQYGDQDVIGLSGLITTLRWQENIAKIIKELQPNTFLVSGNGLATEFGIILFDWIPELDAVALAEGDDIILEIAHDAKTNQRKRIYQGHPVLNLDELPLPAYDLLEQDPNGFQILDFYLKNPIWGDKAINSSATPFTMERSINTVSSRGCPFSCKFCFRGQQGGKNYRARSAENLAKEAKFYLKEYQLDFIGYSDDNFMISPKRIAELTSLMRPLKIRWGTHGRLDEANEDERVYLMAEAGCVYIGLGGESASSTVLRNMNKGGRILAQGEIMINGYLFPRTMVQGIQKTIKAGVHPNCTWIMGWPGETLKDLQTTVAFIKWQEENYPQGAVNKSIFTATAYPGTDLFLDPVVRQKLKDSFGIKFDTNNNPICDQNMRKYVLELDDATKVLLDQTGKPLNFSAMPDELFLQAKKHIAEGETLKILDL